MGRIGIPESLQHGFSNLRTSNTGRHLRHGAGVLCTLLLYLTRPLAAEADDDTGMDAAAEGPSTSPMVIVVTPQWRPLPAQRLPTTVDVFTDGKLDGAGVHDTQDLQYRVPGFVFKTNSVLGQPYLRGVGSDIISAGAESSVATFVDGIYQARAAGSIRNLYDIDRVEVLKGPQGVHLGRNAVGGAVSIITNDPVPYAEAGADVLFGSFDRRRLRGLLNLPLADGRLALRIAGLYSARDGYTDNVFLGRKLDDEALSAWRGKLRLAPSRQLNILFGAESSHENDTRKLGQWPYPNVGINGGVALGGTVPDDPRQVTHNVAQAAEVAQDRYSATLSWDLGGVALRSTTAYQESDTRLTLDLDGTNADFSTNEPSEHSEMLSQELRLMSQPLDRAIGWIAGIYLLHEHAVQQLDVRLPLYGVRSRSRGAVDTDAYAAFGQVSYEFASRWEVITGIRYSHDRRRLDLVQTNEDTTGTETSTQDSADSWDALTPELALRFTLDPATTLYVKAARAFKSGGFNTSAVQPSFAPERLWAYEAGCKSAFPGGRLNAALFYYDYRDMQLLTLPEDAPAGTYPTVTNAAAATVKGLDLELWLEPVERFGLTLGLTWLDARFDDFLAVDPNNPDDDPDRSGKPLPQAPDLSLNLGASYRWPLDNGAQITLNGAFRYQSAVYFNAFNDPAVRQGGYGLIDASLVFDGPRGHWYAGLYGRNLTDRLYAENIIRQDPLAGTQYFWGAPRTLGLQVGYRL